MDFIFKVNTKILFEKNSLNYFYYSPLAKSWKNQTHICSYGSLPMISFAILPKSLHLS